MAPYVTDDQCKTRHGANRTKILWITGLISVFLAVAGYALLEADTAADATTTLNARQAAVEAKVDGVKDDFRAGMKDVKEEFREGIKQVRSDISEVRDIVLKKHTGGGK